MSLADYNQVLTQQILDQGIFDTLDDLPDHEEFKMFEWLIDCLKQNGVEPILPSAKIFSKKLA